MAASNFAKKHTDFLEYAARIPENTNENFNKYNIAWNKALSKNKEILFKFFFRSLSQAFQEKLETNKPSEKEIMVAISTLTLGDKHINFQISDLLSLAEEEGSQGVLVNYLLKLGIMSCSIKQKQLKSLLRTCCDVLDVSESEILQYAPDKPNMLKRAMSLMSGIGNKSPDQLKPEFNNLVSELGLGDDFLNTIMNNENLSDKIKTMSQKENKGNSKEFLKQIVNNVIEQLPVDKMLDKLGHGQVEDPADIDEAKEAVADILQQQIANDADTTPDADDAKDAPVADEE